jgi:transcription elongation factor GreA-like protein
MTQAHPISALCLVFGLLVSGVSTHRQFLKDDCSVQIVRLKSDDTFQPDGEHITTRILLLAKATDTILVNNTDIIKFSIQTDTVCCTYAGSMYV